MVCPKCSNKIVNFQGELFEVDRGRYICTCGYRSGSVYKERRLAGGAQTSQRRLDTELL